MGCAGPRAPRKETEGFEVNSYEAVQEALATGRKLVIYEDLVLDVTTFVHEHPGTSRIIEQNVGNEGLVISIRH